MEPPVFPAGPHVLRAAPGEDASLDLPLPSGTPPFKFEWSRAGSKLNERYTSFPKEGGVRLSITSAKTGDSGVYTLQASNAAGKDTTRVRVEVPADEMPIGDDPPTFLRRLQDLTVKVGTRTRFLVEIVSSTECRVTWYRNDRRLMEAERIALVRDGNFWCADVSAVSVEDGGRWTCTAENIGGRANCSAHLNVLVPKAYKRPEFVDELRALLTEQGTVSLECKVIGVPTPVLRWFKDSREIKAGDVFALTANAEDPTSLGTYTCEAVNCMGRAYSSSKVQVVGRASREGSVRPSTGGVIEPPPIFTKELEDQFVRICEPLTLSCQIVVPPWPRNVVWYNKEGKVEASDKYHILEDGVGGYFIEIQTSEFADEGEWKCVATSAGGRVGISTCYVSMDVPKNYRKPRFMENLQAILTEEGLVSFECKVVGFPTPVLSWFKDGQELKPGDVYQLTGTNSLGSYCCIAKNFMGQASSSAELTVEDIQNQLNEDEKLQLFSKNQAPKFLQGLKSVEAKIDEPFRFTIKVAIPPEPTVLWYRDEQPIDESSRCHLGNEERGVFFLDIQNLEFMDQAEWKCVALNDYGQSVTSCFLRLVIPRHYKKPRFLENLQAILSDEGAVNLECKVIGVPQPVLKWYKDGEELKPGDIHRIISGQDGTCCLGTYTCEAQNCMGIAASSASLLGFEDSIKAKNKKVIDDQALQRNLSLSTIHEERTSQMYDTPVGDITLDDKGEISFSFDGKEVSVSLYETPDLTEEEALQIVEMYADQLSENVTEHNVVELPPLRFVKETSTSGNLLMEAIIIDVSPEYFTSPEEDLRTEADIEDISIADENGPPQLSLDQDVSGVDYVEKSIALLSEEHADIPKKIKRNKSDSQKSGDDYYSLSRDRSSSLEKKDDDTQVLSESELQSFASAHSTGKAKSKSSKPSFEDGQESSDFTKTVLLKEDLKGHLSENINVKKQRERRNSLGSISSEKSIVIEPLETGTPKEKNHKIVAENIKLNMMAMSSSLTKVMNAIQIIERDIILKSELMPVAATASRSLEIINSLITPLSEIHSITDSITEIANESPEIVSSLFNRLPQSLRLLEQSLTIVEKCIDFESENKTLVKRTCILLIEKCGDILNDLMTTVNTINFDECSLVDEISIFNIKAASENISKSLKSSVEASRQDKILNETRDVNTQEANLETKHLHHTQRVLYSLKSSLKSMLLIIEESNKSVKIFAEIENWEIILDEISTPIQELQNSLEQIETLSVSESNSNLPYYNTEIIETVMNSILKLRTAFEQLSIVKENKINEVLLDIKEYIDEISSKLVLFEEKNGKFDILNSDNKLEVLQTMAQILISLENGLPMLDTVPTIKINMSEFHKNLTKALENVIESNDSNKYFALLEICNAVNRINTSLNNMESRQMLSLAIISNTLKIIKKCVHLTVFDTCLNNSLLNNIVELLLNIEETMNQIDETSIKTGSEKVDDLSINKYKEVKLNIVLEHVQKSIAAISKVTTFENVSNLNISHVLENINPILTQIHCCLASSNINVIKNSEHVSDISISSFTDTIAHPLYELHQNISVLNEVMSENARNQDFIQLAVFAEPLIHLQTALEILQNDLISQYDELLSSPEIMSAVANSLDNLQSCIVMVQEHDMGEVVDDMSTLADISGIQTSADILLSIEEYLMPIIETVNVKEAPVHRSCGLQTFTVKALQTIMRHIVNLQSLVIEENVNKWSNHYAKIDLKSLILESELINSNILSIFHSFERNENRQFPIISSQLALLIWPLKNFQNSLSNILKEDIPINEENKETPCHIHPYYEILSNFKLDLDSFLNVISSAVETVDNVFETASKKIALRQISTNLESLLGECTDSSIDKFVESEIINLRTDINNALNINCSEDIVAGNISEKVNRTLPKIEDEAFKLTAHNLNIISYEAKLVEILQEIEQNVVILEHCNFNAESATLTSQTDDLSQIYTITNIDIFNQLDQMNSDTVTKVYGELNENTEKDIKDIDEFFSVFTKELSLLGYLIKNLTSVKKDIKSMQVFYSLCRKLDDFKTQFHNTLSEECKEYLQICVLNIEDRLKTIQAILIQNISSQTKSVFDILFTKINDGEQFLKNILQSEDDSLLQETYSTLLNVIESLKPFNDEWKCHLIEELRTFDPKNLPVDNINVTEIYNVFSIFLAEQARTSLENPVKRVMKQMIDVVQKHEDLKGILGMGSRIILLKCVSDCLDILKQNFLERPETGRTEKCLPKDINIDEVLLEISNPLESINTQIMNIRNKLLLALRSDIDLADVKLIESHVDEIKKINEEIKHCVSNQNYLMETNDLILAVELNDKISSIFNNLNNLDNNPCFEVIKALIQPIKEIEENLGLVISSHRNFIEKQSLNNKAKVDALLQQMEQHIEIIEIVEEVSAVIKLEDLKKTASIVRELRDSIAGTEAVTDSDDDKCRLMNSDQSGLTDKLQKALTCLHSQALDCSQGTESIKGDIRQQVIDVVSDLQEDLVHLNNISSESWTDDVKAVTQIMNENEKYIDDSFDKNIEKVQFSDKLQLSSFAGDEIENKQSFKNIPEDVTCKKLLIGKLLQNIQEYSCQDFTVICQEFSSILNYEAIKTTKEICQAVDLRDIITLETTGYLTIPEEKQKIIFKLHNNLQHLFSCEPAKLLEEVVDEDKLHHFKNVVYNLCQAIENILNFTNITIPSDAEGNGLSVGSPTDVELKARLSTDQCEELLSVISETGTISGYGSGNNYTNNEVIIAKEDLKTKEPLHDDTTRDKGDTEYISSGVTESKEVIAQQEDKLASCISEYISEEVTHILKDISPALNTENLLKTHDIANQLVTLCTVANFDDSNFSNYTEKKLDLCIQLNEALILINEEIFVNPKILQTIDNESDFQKVRFVLKNLNDALQTNITFEETVSVEQALQLDEESINIDPLSINVNKTEGSTENLNLFYQIENQDIVIKENSATDQITVHEINQHDIALIDPGITHEEVLTSDQENEISSVQMLGKLLEEVCDSIENVENSDTLQNNLDEVQSVIIKLKCDFDGTKNETLNETLEDLECNVRSVQLQINEHSAPALLKEACLNLQVIVSSLSEIELKNVKEKALKCQIIDILINCQNESSHTIDLLDNACNSENTFEFENIILSLNHIKDIIKSLRNNFVGDAESLIVKGIEVTQYLDQIEDKIFLLEKDVDKLEIINSNVKDNIVSAMHSVYGTISNMRGAVSSIQKKYMYENYGKPTQNFLKSIRNLDNISQMNPDNEKCWKQCGKILRQVLNHFEDIKFYINFDRTARIPNDAAFTKIILQEIVTVLGEVQGLKAIPCDIIKTIENLSNYVADKRNFIEGKTTLEVKEKIPIFIDLSHSILKATETIKKMLQDLKTLQTRSQDSNILLEKCTEVQHIVELNTEIADTFSIDDSNKYEDTIKEIVQEDTLQKVSLNIVSVLFKDYDQKEDEQIGTNKENVFEHPKQENAKVDKEFQIIHEDKDHNIKDVLPHDDESFNSEIKHTEDENDQITPHNDSCLPAIENENVVNIDCNQKVCLIHKECNIIPLSNVEENILTPDDVNIPENKKESSFDGNDQKKKDVSNNAENLTPLLSKEEVNAQGDEATTNILKEDNKVVNINKDNMIKDSEILDIIGKTNSSTNTQNRPISEKLQSHAIAENLDLNQQRGTLEILVQTLQSAILTNDDDIIIQEKVNQNSISNIKIETDVEENHDVVDVEAITVTDRENSLKENMKTEKKENLSLDKQENIALQFQEIDLSGKEINTEYQLITIREDSTIFGKGKDIQDNEQQNHKEIQIKTSVTEDNKDVDELDKIITNKTDLNLEKDQESNENSQTHTLNDLNNYSKRKEDIVLDCSEDDIVLAPVISQNSEPLVDDENSLTRVAAVVDSAWDDSRCNAQVNIQIFNINEKVKEEKETDTDVIKNSNIDDHNISVKNELLSDERNFNKTSKKDKMEPGMNTNQELNYEVTLLSNEEDKNNQQKEKEISSPGNEQFSISKWMDKEKESVNIVNDSTDNYDQKELIHHKVDSNKGSTIINISEKLEKADEMHLHENDKVKKTADVVGKVNKEYSDDISSQDRDIITMCNETLKEDKQKLCSDNIEQKEIKLSAIYKNNENGSANIILENIVNDTVDLQPNTQCISNDNDENITFDTIVKTDDEAVVIIESIRDVEHSKEQIPMIKKEKCHQKPGESKVEKQESEEVKITETSGQEQDKNIQSDLKLELECKNVKDVGCLDNENTIGKKELDNFGENNLLYEIKTEELEEVAKDNLKSEHEISANLHLEKGDKRDHSETSNLYDDFMSKDIDEDILKNKQKLIKNNENTVISNQVISTEALVTEKTEVLNFDQTVKRNKELEENKCKGSDEMQSTCLQLLKEDKREDIDQIKSEKTDTSSGDKNPLVKKSINEKYKNIVKDKDKETNSDQIYIKKELTESLEKTHENSESQIKLGKEADTLEQVFIEVEKSKKTEKSISEEDIKEIVQSKEVEVEIQIMPSQSNVNEDRECCENTEIFSEKLEIDTIYKNENIQNAEQHMSENLISLEIAEFLPNEQMSTDNITNDVSITELKESKSVKNCKQKNFLEEQNTKKGRDFDPVTNDEDETNMEISSTAVKVEENQETFRKNTLQTPKEILGSEHEVKINKSFEVLNKTVSGLEKVVKTDDKNDKNEKDVMDNSALIENSTQINNNYKNAIEEKEIHLFNKNNENDTSINTNEIKLINEQEKYKKVNKKKLKSDKKGTLEKITHEHVENSTNGGAKQEIKKEDTKDKLFKRDTEKPLFEIVDEKQNKLEYEEKEILATDDCYKIENNNSVLFEKETGTYRKQDREGGRIDSTKFNDRTEVNMTEFEKEKYLLKESPVFIDHKSTDYSLDFPRPPNYTQKYMGKDNYISPELHISTKNPTIYKAQTLVQDHQTRSSYSPQIDQIDQSSNGHAETQRIMKRSRSTAVSEPRSSSEKRQARDLKRKPVFSTFLTDRTAVESSRVKLTCSILSSSDPTVMWYKNGVLLNDKQKFRSKCVDGLITLEVLNAVPNDSGEYSCTVENETGSVTSTANLKVYPIFESSPIPPTFTRSIRDVYHSFENELVLECRIRGQPLPSITWYKDDKPIMLCERYQAHYLADGVCRLTINCPTNADSGKYTCHAESSVWSDEISHNVQFSGKEHSVSPNIMTLEKVHLSRQAMESRKPHFTNVISDYKVVSGGTIGLQVEIKGSPTRVEWLRDGCSVIDTYRHAQTYFDSGIYTLALSDVTEKETGLYTCRAWSSHGNVDMNASITVIHPNQIDGKPAVIVSRPAKDILISVGEDINISFRAQGEPKPKVFFMKGLRDITYSQRVCKMTSDDYIKFTMKRSVISDAGTYCILARNAYGCDRAFVTVVIRQRASSENLVSDWTYPMDDLAMSSLDRNYKAVPDRIPSEPSVVDGGKNWVSLAWPKPDYQTRAPILAYKVESWLIGKEGGARWTELGITPRNSFDAFNLKQEEEYHFRVTPRNRYGWGESVQTSTPVGIGLTGDRPEFIEILPGQCKVLVGETATLYCTFKGKPAPEIVWMKNGHDVEEVTKRFKITQNSFNTCLNIENVNIEDEGRYSCEALNIHGRSSTYARMTVITDRNIWEADAKLKRERSAGLEGEYPPQFTMRLRDRRVQATYPVRLTCQVVGSPAPNVVWLKNGKEVTADDRHSMSQDEFFYTLEIAPTTLDDDGVYESNARNNSGAISCRCNLVVDKGIRAYVAPEFCCGLEPLYQLREGEELRISAVVEAYPSVGVCWYRDGVRLRPSRRAIMTLDRDGQIELALAAVTARDAGVYTCTASNEVGRVSTSGKVEIIAEVSCTDNNYAPPIFVSDESSRALYSNEPRFLRKPRSSEAHEGDTVIIECEVIGDPKPEVYWLRDFLKPDYYRDSNHFKRIEAGPEYRFEIPHAKLDYTGAYSVVAKNIHGEAKAIISLQILARDPNSSQDVHNIRYGRVEEIPRFEKELTDLLCYDGDAIEFECRVSANPDPFIRWFHYTEVVPDCSDFETSYNSGTARLKINQVTAEDEGTYKCEASNSLGKVTSSACLVVYPPGEPNTLSQSLRRPPALLSAASTPRSTPRATPRSTPRSTPARSLSATPGLDCRRLCSPSREIAPKFYTYPFNRVAEEGDTVVFQCAVKGLPPPWATWDKDGIIVTATTRINIKEKDEMFRILEIEEVTIEDVGLYRITLENDYGRAEASARLEVISGKGKFHGTTRSFSASPSRRALTYRRRTPSYSRLD